MEYKPHIIFRSGHLNTIYPSLFRKNPIPPYERRTLDTPDGDFLDVDELNKDNKRLVILCHGLEGSSQSHYIRGSATLLHAQGWDVAAMNYRGCSGRMNSKLRMYHSGATGDLDVLVSYYLEHYEELALVGFSLGGNLILKYAGEKGAGLDRAIRSMVAISVPTDLGAGSLHLGKPSNFIYEWRFLRMLKEKVRKKQKQFPDALELSDLRNIKKLYDFDDVYTAPIHGFLNAQDYYARCSSKRFIPFIKRPALILNAQDDPFLPPACYPVEACEGHPYVTLTIPRYGGHVGFQMPGLDVHYNELRTAEFIGSHSLVS